MLALPDSGSVTSRGSPTFHGVAWRGLMAWWLYGVAWFDGVVAIWCGVVGLWHCLAAFRALHPTVGGKKMGAGRHGLRAERFG
jgi:hypothetical protein